MADALLAAESPERANILPRRRDEMDVSFRFVRQNKASMPDKRTETVSAGKQKGGSTIFFLFWCEDPVSFFTTEQEPSVRNESAYCGTPKPPAPKQAHTGAWGKAELPIPDQEPVKSQGFGSPGIGPTAGGARTQSSHFSLYRMADAEPMQL